jgi:hypothetical protein
MIGLAVLMIKLPLKMMFVTLDMCVLMCTLGKVDPRTRRVIGPSTAIVTSHAARL